MPPTEEKVRLAETLNKAIKGLKPIKGERNKRRYVARYYFGFKGEKVGIKVSEWIRSPSSISETDIPKIREVLARLAGSKATAQANAPANNPDYNRVVQRHAVSLLSSLKALVNAVDDKTVADDTRMSIKSSLETIGRQFGLTATYRT